MSSPAFATGRPLAVTSPAMISAWAFSRLGARPRTVTSLSALSFIAAAEGRPAEFPDPPDEPRDVEAERRPDLLGLAQGVGTDRQAERVEPDIEPALAVEELAHRAPGPAFDDPVLQGHHRPPGPGE